MFVSAEEHCSADSPQLFFIWSNYAFVCPKTSVTGWHVLCQYGNFSSHFWFYNTFNAFILNFRYWWFQFPIKGAISRYLAFFLKIPFWGKYQFCLQLNPQNNGLGLLFKTILWRLFCFLSFIDTDGKDGNGLKLEKFMLNFSSFDVISTKNTKTLLWVPLFKTFH